MRIISTNKKVVIALDKIEKEAKERKKAFAQTLKKANKPQTIRVLPMLHEDVFEQVDCLQCANCCKNYSPRFKMPDIKRIAKYLGMKEVGFIEQYLFLDEDGDYVLQSSPCHFLDSDNTCSIYEVRPRDCYRYPYTDEDVLVKQAKLTLKNSEICPAVFAILEKLEKAVR